MARRMEAVSREIAAKARRPATIARESAVDFGGKQGPFEWGRKMPEGWGFSREGQRQTLESLTHSGGGGGDGNRLSTLIFAYLF